MAVRPKRAGIGAAAGGAGGGIPGGAGGRGTGAIGYAGGPVFGDGGEGGARGGIGTGLGGAAYGPAPPSEKDRGRKPRAFSVSFGTEGYLANGVKNSGAIGGRLAYPSSFSSPLYSLGRARTGDLLRIRARLVLGVSGASSGTGAGSFGAGSGLGLANIPAKNSLAGTGGL